ncbi:hypothetical protein ACJRO7_004000 [Eucalyptus globulus]|uniref:Glycosyltransferase 61 catalytic domain-containing protein n=1 Tax=Eucalyptus globulus TaxID=34317 RepID=A0ABD3IVM0_EUCGL
MDLEKHAKVPTKRPKGCSCQSPTLVILFTSTPLLVLLLFRIQSFTFSTPSGSTSWEFFQKWTAITIDSTTDHSCSDRLGKSNSQAPGVTRLSDTVEENEAEYLYFPFQGSKGRILCIKGRDSRDGSKNSYALAWPESLPESATLLEGLTFVSDTYYDYLNLWHGLYAVAPFVGWSMKNQCLKPTRWVLFHWGELRSKMGAWAQNLMRATYGDVARAVVMRHNIENMGKKKRVQVSEQLRCKAREFCGINTSSKVNEVNERGEPVVNMTLLMRRGSRSFRNASAVVNVFTRECERVDGCALSVVRVMTYTDIMVSPHGAQLTNMLFMEQGSRVMEFFSRGWLELAGIGRHAHRWTAELYGQVGHNETFFAEWTRDVLSRVRESKLEEAKKRLQPKRTTCVC